MNNYHLSLPSFGWSNSQMTKQVNCSDAGMDCDFMVRSEDESEVIELVKRHAEHAHDQTMSTADIRGVMKDA